MIEVPPTLISLSLYRATPQDNLKFNEYISNNKYDKRLNKVGFEGSIQLDKFRLAHFFLSDIEITKYNISYYRGNIKRKPIKVSFTNSAIFIINSKGYIEIVGENAENKSIIKSILNNIQKELKININTHPILSHQSILHMQDLLMENKLIISRVSYLLEEQDGKIKRNDYGINLATRFSQCITESSDILAIAG